MRIKPSFPEVLVILSIVGVLAGLLMPTGDQDRRHRYPPPSPEPRPLPGGVAGEYYLGDGRGTNLRLSILPDGRYSFVSSGCTGVHRRESGHVRTDEDHLVLEPLKPGEPRVERTFDLIGWGQRRYLIPLTKLQEFRDAIVEGREPRYDEHGWFYARLPLAPADGLPDSPPGWARALRRDLLVGRVLEVGDVGRVKVDLGRSDGLCEGDVLTVQRREIPVYRRLRVVSVADHSCVAVEPFPGEAEHPLETGQAVVGVKPSEGAVSH